MYYYIYPLPGKTTYPGCEILKVWYFLKPILQPSIFKISLLFISDVMADFFHYLKCFFADHSILINANVNSNGAYTFAGVYIFSKLLCGEYWRFHFAVTVSVNPLTVHGNQRMILQCSAGAEPHHTAEAGGIAGNNNFASPVVLPFGGNWKYPGIQCDDSIGIACFAGFVK